MKLNIPKLLFSIALCTGFILFGCWIVSSEQENDRQELREQAEQDEIDRENWSVSNPQSETSNFNDLKLKKCKKF